MNFNMPFLRDDLSIDLLEFQRDIKIWQTHNFPDSPSNQSLLGLVEEVGELAHAQLKAEQGIRGTPEEHRAAKIDAVGDIMVYLADYCNKEGINIEETVSIVWSSVRERDWIKFPKNGRTE